MLINKKSIGEKNGIIWEVTFLMLINVDDMEGRWC
jgi:hypothetical protein